MRIFKCQIRTIFFCFFLGYLSFSLFPFLYATPPTPPVKLIIPDLKSLTEIQPKEGFFFLPCRVLGNEKISDLEVVMSLNSPHPIRAEQIARETYKLKPIEKGQTYIVEIKVPLQKKLGYYLADLRVEGTYKGQRGVLDRKLIYQLVEESKQYLVDPFHFRRMKSQEHKSEFRNALKERPQSPEIRLLSDDTFKVHEQILKEVKPLIRKHQLIVKGVGPSEDLKPYLKDKTQEIWGNRDPIVVRGQILFRDFEGTWRPLINVSVNLYDDDFGGDDHLGTTVTDWNGNWSFSVNNNDGWLQDGRDIYYTFHLGNTRWHVRDGDGDDYRWKSATHDDLSDGTVLDFGSETGSTNMEAMQIFSMINLGWNHITTAGGQDPGHVEIRFPESNTAWSSSSEQVRVEAAYNDGPDVVLHEYGHALMYYAFGGTRISPGGSHSFNDLDQDQGLAYSEGWATGYAMSVCPDGMYNWHEGNSEDPGEWPNCSVQNDPGRSIENFSSANREGEKTEGRVAASINDFRDYPNDDNGGDEDRGRNGKSDQNSSNRITLATLYRDSMWGYVHDDFLEYWITLSGELSGAYQERADEIMQYNWMSLPVDISCAATKIAVAERKDHKELLDGLRLFRDQALKPLYLGRCWIQIYYRHSPELAVLFIKDQEIRKAGLMIIEHFSRVGRAIKENKTMTKLIESNQKFLPEEIAHAINFVLNKLNETGSEELKEDIRELPELVQSLEGLSFLDIMMEGTQLKEYQKDQLRGAIKPTQFEPGSKKVNWEIIKEYLAKTKKKRENDKK